MTALRQEALSMLEQCPEEKLAMLVDLMRPMCTPAECELPDDGTDPLVFLSGLLAGTPSITAKELREERLTEKYTDYLF